MQSTEVIFAQLCFYLKMLRKEIRVDFILNPNMMKRMILLTWLEFLFFLTRLNVEKSKLTN